MEFLKMLFHFAWALFSIKWPGLPFSFGSAFFAVLISVSSLALILRLFGLSLPRINSASYSGGNNSRIRVSDSRKGDEK